MRRALAFTLGCLLLSATPAWGAIWVVVPVFWAAWSASSVRTAFDIQVESRVRPGSKGVGCFKVEHRISQWRTGYWHSPTLHAGTFSTDSPSVSGNVSHLTQFANSIAGQLPIPEIFRIQAEVYKKVGSSWILQSSQEQRLSVGKFTDNGELSWAPLAPTVDLLKALGVVSADGAQPISAGPTPVKFDFGDMDCSTDNSNADCYVSFSTSDTVLTYDAGQTRQFTFAEAQTACLHAGYSLAAASDLEWLRTIRTGYFADKSCVWGSDGPAYQPSPAAYRPGSADRVVDPTQKCDVICRIPNCPAPEAGGGASGSGGSGSAPPTSNTGPCNSPADGGISCDALSEQFAKLVWPGDRTPEAASRNEALYRVWRSSFCGSPVPVLDQNGKVFATVGYACKAVQRDGYLPGCGTFLPVYFDNSLGAAYIPANGTCTGTTQICVVPCYTSYSGLGWEHADGAMSSHPPGTGPGAPVSETPTPVPTSTPTPTPGTDMPTPVPRHD